MSDDDLLQSSMILYQTEDGRTCIQCRFDNQTLWLTQALIAELFQKDVRTINEHLVNLYDEGELDRDSTIRKFRIVRREGSREVSREIEHYSLPAILAVGYRVRAPRGTQPPSANGGACCDPLSLPPRRGTINQPRATPWVGETNIHPPALKGRDRRSPRRINRLYRPFRAPVVSVTATQGVALGWCVRPLRGEKKPGLRCNLTTYPFGREFLT